MLDKNKAAPFLIALINYKKKKNKPPHHTVNLIRIKI